MQTTRVDQGYGMDGLILHMALELSAAKWLVGFSVGGTLRRVVVDARDTARLLIEIGKAKGKLGLSAQARVVSCYEAGRDGHWLHRWLVSQGIENHEVDSASIAVDRRAKQVKTDKVDLAKLMAMLVRFERGDADVWRVVRVPSPEAEDQKRLYREREQLKKDRTRHSNRIGSLLIAQGVAMKVGKDFEKRLAQARLWNGEALPTGLHDELLRQWHRYRLVDEQLGELERQQTATLQTDTSDPAVMKMQALTKLRAIGPQTAWVMVRELFSRQIRNRREVGALTGLTPTPYDSGSSTREQGISKAGITRVRVAAIEMAWMWLRLQPTSALSQWFQVRFGGTSKRSRRVGIVALARKLVVALWRYADHGVLPEGALLKTV